MLSLYQEACKYIPGGVNSPVRAFRSVGGEPIFLKKAAGSAVIAADGRSYIDYVGSWGPMILGHAHPKVIAAVQAVAADGLSFGAHTELETTLNDPAFHATRSREARALITDLEAAKAEVTRLYARWHELDQIGN